MDSWAKVFEQSLYTGSTHGLHNRAYPRDVPLEGHWQGFRFLLGPWRWMLIVYEYFESEDRVVIVTIQDGRSSAAATAAR